MNEWGKPWCCWQGITVHGGAAGAIRESRKLYRSSEEKDEEANEEKEEGATRKEREDEAEQLQKSNLVVHEGLHIQKIKITKWNSTSRYNTTSPPSLSLPISALNSSSLLRHNTAARQRPLPQSSDDAIWSFARWRRWSGRRCRLLDSCTKLSASRDGAVLLDWKEER
ncbi:hypothetical protein BCR35DRAFT_165033 [Leucosporidium creatinivorum]|uniref:Uncharacterized protein n=1 Tax=Leucosporidium creatinivorum TaxID=106004 RepID=A0A1Y2EKZ2_9BASI|nr:hypothetical protein BCR35DRAFT_165033 [Leucosporidium creatinivorum]